ncbi:MAG: hypothetical protein GY811_29170 [Myxococcales bacterium]|nr:hypothetical protein [Myxococcales bacterium]
MKDEGEDGNHAFKLLLEEAIPLAELRESKTSKVVIRIDATSATEEDIEALRGILVGASGKCVPLIILQIPGRSQTAIYLGDTFRVAPTDELLASLNQLFGANSTAFA